MEKRVGHCGDGHTSNWVGRDTEFPASDASVCTIRQRRRSIQLVQIIHNVDILVILEES